MKRLDLNLLSALDALLRERSVSRAAERVGIGQPAMSASLARLRALFGDDLLVRTPNGMEPTPRARAIAEPLRRVLVDLRSLVDESAAFEPARSRRTFVISGGDYVGMVVLPRLIADLRNAAPGVDVRFRFLEKDAIESCLDNGDIDLALYYVDSVPVRFDRQYLFEDHFVCALRKGHPLLSGQMTPQTYADADHLLVTERGDQIGVVDRALAQAQLSRRILLTVPSVALVADVLRTTDLIATVGERATRCMTYDDSITTIAPPITMERWRMSMVWLGRNSRDEGLAWFRQRLLDAAN